MPFWFLLETKARLLNNCWTALNSRPYVKENLETFVIIASNEDLTTEICKKYEHTTCHCLTEEQQKTIKSKGATLQAMIKKLYADGGRFDGYFIIDADNVMRPDFIELMHNAFCAGNDLVLGARLNKKKTGHWVSCGSTLTFSYVNTLNNKCRSENGQNIVVQGSPLLVSKKIVEDFWGGD